MLVGSLLALAVTLSFPPRGALVTSARRPLTRRLCASAVPPADMPAASAVPPTGMPAGLAAVWAKLNAAALEESDLLGLELTEVSFARGKLSVLARGGGVEELEALNRRLGELLDAWEAGSEGAEGDERLPLPPYMLEVASPGVSDVLLSDIDFEVFKGFLVGVALTEEFRKKKVHKVAPPLPGPGPLPGCLAPPCALAPAGGGARPQPDLPRSGHAARARRGARDDQPQGPRAEAAARARCGGATALSPD